MKEVIRVRLEFGSYRESRKNREAAVRNCPAPIADSLLNAISADLTRNVEFYLYACSWTDVN